MQHNPGKTRQKSVSEASSGILFVNDKRSAHQPCGNAAWTTDSETTDGSAVALDLAAQGIDYSSQTTDAGKLRLQSDNAVAPGAFAIDGDTVSVTFSTLEAVRGLPAATLCGAEALVKPFEDPDTGHVSDVRFTASLALRAGADAPQDGACAARVSYADRAGNTNEADLSVVGAEGAPLPAEAPWWR